MDKKQMRELIRAHLEEEAECRWCFAIDKQRVAGKEIAQYHFPDALLLHYSCPRCGSEWSVYSEGWTQEYLNERMYELHPEWKGNIGDEQAREILDLVVPEYSPILDC